MTVVRDQLFHQKPPGSRFWFSRTGVQPSPGSSTIELPSAFSESGAAFMSDRRPNHMGHTQHQANVFRMSANDVPEQLILRGTSDEHVPTVLAQFRKRVELKGDLHVPPLEIDKRAVRFLPLFLNSVALETYSQLTLGVLEC